MVMNVLWTAMRPLCGWSPYSAVNIAVETGNTDGADC